MNRRGFFGRMAGFLAFLLVPKRHLKPPVRDTGAGKITVTNFTSLLPGDLPSVTYFAIKGDSKWKRVD